MHGSTSIFWANLTPFALQDTLSLLAHCATLWPGPRLASGTIVTGGFGFGWSPPDVFRTVLTTSLRELRRGAVDNALVYNAKGMLASNLSYYEALGVPKLLEEELWNFI
jgi:hypothetical protein